MTDRSQELEQLVAEVLQSAKYREVGEQIIRHIGARELQARRNLREAVKATKNKLHQIGGAYLDQRMPYARWLEEIAAAAQSGDPDRLKAACQTAMRQHASTRERQPLLEQFYAELWQIVPRSERVLDLACGLHPLGLPWMGLPNGVHYYACDIYADMMAFIDTSLGLMGAQASGFVCDLVTEPPQQQVDLVFALKLLPVLEQRDKAAGLNLLRALQARTLVVSYPSASLGGRNRQMGSNYERHFRSLVAEEGWQIERLSFTNELVFVVTKP
jgi:16S rRNA (guanine(1405)-N(7))-methyltransferase